MSKTIDPDFLALALTATADAALSAAKNAGASHVDVRIERIRTGYLQLRDAHPGLSLADAARKACHQR